MNEAWKTMWISAKKSQSSREVLYETNQTIAELETYLETNPDDEIALVQLQQFLTKRHHLTLLLTEAFDNCSQTELQA
ncbi:hypothetical protein BK133_00580 [Paenibacillus sp. FSL H8-0548]|uniref:hypothetical protein n=1 Tax=Paenibacillus sp. FSL H8-0548 TaxID=1920422 RepID=UPI00096BD7DB|nr:hypothetical protein [Paenibacillus sp. FSL H8-0548]OMF38738.1 hypothetical protein BK133_00580 [Paenibacillus sp. FSL H8-0548]